MKLTQLINCIKGYEMVAPNNKEGLGLQVINNIKFHPDIKDYLWIGTERDYKSIFKVNYSLSREPSFININLPVEVIDDLDLVEKLDYYPNYSKITPKQRYKYLKFLENPFTPNFEIGYVFIFYYGLERFMYTDKYDGAIKLIIRLLENHCNNDSFVSYAVSSILFRSIDVNNYNYLEQILKIDNIMHKLSLPLITYIFYITGRELTADDIILLSKDVGWKKNTYLKEHKNIFVKNLSRVIKENIDAVTIRSLMGKDYIENLKVFSVCRIANTTADYTMRDAKLPNLLLDDMLKENILNLMERAHTITKTEVAEMRKNGMINPKIINGKCKEIQVTIGNTE